MKTIMFDMYGVIIKEPRGNFKQFLSERKPDADYGLYQTDYKPTSIGKMDYKCFMSLFGFINPSDAGNDYVKNFLTYDEGFTGFAEKCKHNGISLALLSNDISEWSRYIRSYYDIDKCFDFCIVSGDIGIRKPDVAIFRAALDKLTCETGECVYIDDNPDNIRIAKSLGCETVLFRRDGGYDGMAVKSFEELGEVLFTNKAVISKIGTDDITAALDVIHDSFATVADQFNLTRENCPRHTSFIPIEYLQTQFGWGWLMFGLYEDGKMVGYASLSDEGGGIFELHNLAVLPEFRRKGYGKMLVDYAKEKVQKSGGCKIKIGIIEENKTLKDWYTANGFVHKGIKKFEHLPFTTGFMEWSE